MEHSTALTQICSKNENEKMRFYLNYVENDNDSDSIENELFDTLSIISSEMLCPNSGMSVDTAVFNFINIYITNNKTITCLQDDLHFLTSMLPKSNRMPKTVFKLFEYIKQQAPPCKIITHYCCKVCQFYYGTSKEALCKACNIGYRLYSFFIFRLILLIKSNTYLNISIWLIF